MNITGDRLRVSVGLDLLIYRAHVYTQLHGRVYCYHNITTINT